MGSASNHQCLIYKGAPAEHLQVLTQVILDKLKLNKRCLYLHSPEMVAEMRACLTGAGLDVEHEIKKGALVLTSDLSHLINGRFNGQRMMDTLRRALDQAHEDGFAGLFATGDMSWEFGGQIDLDELVEYEYALEEFLQTNPSLSGICQYCRDSLPLSAVQVALVSHKNIWVNQALALHNPHYQKIKDIHTPEDVEKSLASLVLHQPGRYAY
jgi:hypothetical protein